MKEKTIGEIIVDKWTGKRRAVTFYIPNDIYEIWKKLKRDCVQAEISLSYDGGTQLLLIYDKIRKIAKEEHIDEETIFQKMGIVIDAMAPVKEKIEQTKEKNEVKIPY